MKPENKFESFLQQAGASYEPLAPKRLSKYLSLVQCWSKKMNLVSNSDVGSLMENHFIPSFWYYFKLQEDRTTRSVIDIGSGAGFPGFVIHILNPKLELYMIESNKKKSLFLRECAEHLKLNPIIENERIEEFKTYNKKNFDVIISRAVTSIKQIVNWSEGLLKRSGTIYLLKGNNYESEKDFNQISSVEITELRPDMAWIPKTSKLKNKVLLKIERT